MCLVATKSYEKQISENIEIYVIRTKKNCDASIGLIKQFAHSDTLIDNLEVSSVIDVVSKLDNISAVLAGSECSVETALKVAEHFNLPHTPTEALLFIRNKKEFRKKMTQAGLSKIAHLHIIKSSKLNIPSNFPFPAVLKPSHVAGSVEVKKVNNKQEAIDSINEIWSSALVDSSCNFVGDLQLEEYIDGKEYSIEGFVYHNSRDVIITSIREKLLGDEPYFIEIGYIGDKEFNLDFTQNVHQYTKDVIEVIGLKCSVFHLKIRHRANGDIVAIKIAIN